VALVPPAFLAAPAAAARQQEDPMTLDFGLQVSRFDVPGHPQSTAHELAAIARAAEEAGFTSLWLMDHMVQIPQIGREWEDMLESWTTLGYLAGVTERIRLGTLVSGLTYRNIAHPAKIVPTLDVLSGGRAMCGIGAAWFEREHRLYGWEFPPRPLFVALFGAREEADDRRDEPQTRRRRLAARGYARHAHADAARDHRQARHDAVLDEPIALATSGVGRHADRLRPAA